MNHKRNLTTLIVCIVVLITGCTSKEAAAILAHYGVTVDEVQASQVAAHYTANPDQIDQALATLESDPPPSTCDVICIIRAVFPDSTEEGAIRVAKCESGLNPEARNPTSSATGLFQIIRATWNAHADRGWVRTDPLHNALTAYRIWRSDGGSWRQWRCRP